MAGEYRRHPDVFLKTVVHWASLGFESSLGSASQPECGMITSLVMVCRAWFMITIFNGSYEDKFHNVPVESKEIRKTYCNVEA